MKTKFLFLSAFLFLSISAFAQKTNTLTNTLSSSNSYAQEAKDFGLQMIKNYYESNCSKVYDKLANEITSFENGQKFLKSTITVNDFCQTSPIRQDMSNSYKLYMNSYTPEVLDHLQFAQLFPNFHFQLQPGDFFFNGNVRKDGSAELFNAADMVRFIIRRTGLNQFTIISM